MQIFESSITLNFPDNNFFRFQDCQGYKVIQEHFKEMDACWFDVAANILYLIELKDWSVADLSQTIYTDQRAWDLVKKSVDSINMMICVLLGKPHAANLKPCIPFDINQDTQFKLLSIVHCKSEDQSYIASMNQTYKTRFKSYATLFNIKTYIVLTHKQATTRFEWID